MTQDGYVVAITALLPLTAAMVITQKNPYSALVMRGILGAVAALVYLLFGAADVALTEALVGTMLSITLYAIAVRSSMTLRLGVLEETDAPQGSTTEDQSKQAQYKILLSNLRQSLCSHHLRLEPVTYPSTTALKEALTSKDVHVICTLVPEKETYRLHTRIPRLYDIFQTHLPRDTVDSIALVPKPFADPTPRPQTESPYPSSSEVQP